MATKENALEKYTKVMDELKDWEEANKSVFETHNKIHMRLIDADNELRDAVAEEGSGVSNGMFTVTVTPQTQRVYDEDKLHKYLTPSEFADAVSDVKRSARITIGSPKE